MKKYAFGLIVVVIMCAVIYTINRGLQSLTVETESTQKAILSSKQNRAAVVKAIAAQPAKEWNFVKQWTGSATKNTETFSVGSEWIILWDTAGDESGAGIFAIDVYDSSGAMVTGLAGVMGSNRDASVQRGAGEYYLSINTTQSYKIRILSK